VREDEEDEEVHNRTDIRNDNDSDGVDADGDDHMTGQDDSEGTTQLIKKLVRYALACDFSRTPIRRDGIREKVLGSNSRAFKKVFSGAQMQLRVAFGMEMAELPVKDRNIMTMEQKRKAAKTGNNASQKEASSNAWTLVSILPEAYRSPAIIPPSRIRSADGEASYVALYTLLISIITLSGGELSDPRLRRHLARLNAAENVPSANPGDGNAPSERTEVALQRMVKQGYLVKVVENKNTGGDDDSTTWYVGPRGKVEVNNEAIANMIRAVYNGGADRGDVNNDELEKKLQTSLKVEERKPSKRRSPGVVEEEEEDQEQANGHAGPSNAHVNGDSGRRRTRRRQEDDDED